MSLDGISIMIGVQLFQKYFVEISKGFENCLSLLIDLFNLLLKPPRVGLVFETGLPGCFTESFLLAFSFSL